MNQKDMFLTILPFNSLKSLFQMSESRSNRKPLSHDLQHPQKTTVASVASIFEIKYKFTLLCCMIDMSEWISVKYY